MFSTTFTVYQKKSKFQFLNWNLDFKFWNLSNEIGIWNFLFLEFHEVLSRKFSSTVTIISWRTRFFSFGFRFVETIGKR